MAQAPKKLIAGHGAPQLGSRGAAAGHDDPVEGSLPLRQLQGKALGGPADPLDLGAGEKLHPPPFQGEPQHIHHGARLVGVGVDPAGGLRQGHKAQGAEVFQGGLRREGGKGREGEVRILPMVMGGQGGEIRQVAPAVAGGQELSAHPGLALENRHPGTLIPGPKGGHHAGGTAADHRNVQKDPSPTEK